MKRLTFRAIALLLALWLPYATGAGAVMEGCAASHSESSASGTVSHTDDTRTASDMHAAHVGHTEASTPQSVQCEQHPADGAPACADCASCVHSSASAILYGHMVQAEGSPSDRLFDGHFSWVPLHLAPDFPPPDSLRL